MGTKERIEILNKSDSVINDLLKRVSNLEFAIEKLEKNEQYKYINGQAYFRQDYVLGREKEIDRLNKIIEIKNNRIQQLMKRTRSARIDKAIEYIENSLSGSWSLNEEYEVVSMNKEQILSILKGEDKE